MTPVPDIDRSQRVRLTALACAALGIYAVVAMTATAVSIALPHSHAYFGDFVFAHFFGFLICSLIVGFLSDRLGRKGFMLAGCLALSAGSVGMLWCDRFWVGMAAMTLSGLGGGALGPPALALTGLIHPKRRSGMISVVEAAFSFGAAGWLLGVAAILRWTAAWHPPWGLEAVIGEGQMWKLPFVLAAPAPLALACIIALVRFPAFHDVKRRDTGSRLMLMRKPFFVVSAAAIFFYAAAEAGTQTWIPRYLKELFDSGILMANASPALFWTAMGCCRLAWPMVLHRLTDRQMLIGSMGLAVVMHGAAVTVGHRWAALLLFGGLGLAFGAVWPILVGGVVKRFPHMAGTATGTIVAASGVGVTLGPFLLGHLAQGGSVKVAMQLAWFITAATLVACILIPRRKAGNPPTPPRV